MPLIFSNNARAILADALPSSSAAPTYNTIVITDVDEGNTFDFPSESAGEGQLATLIHPSLPGIYEVVRITQHSYNSDTFTVERGFELGAWAVQAWPAGTIMQARVTAQTLKTFPQQEKNGLVVFPGSETGIDEFAFGSYPSLRDQRAYPTNGTPSMYADKLFAAQSVGGSIAMDLGVAETWVSGKSYYGLAVVKPTVPDGFQYWMDLRGTNSRSQTTTTPLFDGNNSPTVAHDGNSPNNKAVGYWVPTVLPIDVTQTFEGVCKLVLCEVGFQAREVTAGTIPNISIGIDGNATKFVNNQPLSSITGASTIHRFPITTSELVGSLRFKVDTAATGGVFRGRFYWRGFFLTDLE